MRKRFMSYPNTFTPLRLEERAPGRSFQADDHHELRRRLIAIGGEDIPAPVKQAWRIAYRGGLAMAYTSGAIVLGGDTPGPLYKLLKRLANESADQSTTTSSLWDMFAPKG